MKVHPVFHASLLETYHQSNIRGRSQPSAPAIEVNGFEEYEVESILDSRIRRGKLEYLVHWQGYPNSERTWEPAINLRNAPEKTAIFHRQHPAQPSSTPRFYTQKIKLLEGSRN